MKKICAVCLSVLLMITSIPVVQAIEDDNSADFYLNEQYGYTYKQSIDESGQITRFYKKQCASVSLSRSSTTTTDSDNIAYVKSVLSDLGMGNDFIDALPKKSLDMYSDAISITSITTYTKSDHEGKILVIDESTALSEAAILRAPPVFPEDFGDDNGEFSSYVANCNDTYMRITYIVTELGNGDYHHSIDATWLTMPFFRGYELIGACVEGHLIDNYSCSGWYSYDATNLLGESANTRVVFPDDDIYVLTNAATNWRASGAVYCLRSDVTVGVDIPITTVSYDNYKSHYEFKSSVTNKTSPLAFASTASYDHMTINVTLPAMNLISENSLSYIGFDVADWRVHRRHATIPEEIEYTP